ncbi:MAG: helix-turn-helix transcriptional regulator [Lachnospiraceae bacterium]|nr:helix-turn-helix transcriptional regulator [Lachnospiraceae bacterium]
MENKTFGDRLASLRTQRNVSAREMSLAMGLNESYISRIENHRSLPSMENFYEICDYLEISPSVFFDEENRMPVRLSELNSSLQCLNDKQLDAVGSIVRDLARK